MRHLADEEQSCLLILGPTYKEPPRPSKSDLATLGIRVQEPFYHHHAERHVSVSGYQSLSLSDNVGQVEKGEEFPLTEYTSYRHHVTNANIHNRAFNYPLVYRSTVAPQVKTEMVEVIVAAIEKHNWKPEIIAKCIKVCFHHKTKTITVFPSDDNVQTSVDSMYGCTWHVIVGEHFTPNITAEVI